MKLHRHAWAYQESSHLQSTELVQFFSQSNCLRERKTIKTYPEVKSIKEKICANVDVLQTAVNDSLVVTTIIIKVKSVLLPTGCCCTLRHHQNANFELQHFPVKVKMDLHWAPYAYHKWLVDVANTLAEFLVFCAWPSPAATPTNASFNAASIFHLFSRKRKLHLFKFLNTLRELKEKQI